MTIGEFLKITFNFVWLIFWFSLIAISPLVALYCLSNGPDWLTNFGFVGPNEQEKIHLPCVLSVILTDILFGVLAFAPYNKWYK